MRMQEPEQWPSSEAPGTTGQEYGTYRAETGQNALEQKIFPQESRVSVLNVLTIVFSTIGFCLAIVGGIGLALALSYNGSQYLLIAGIFGPAVSIVVLLLFVTIFVLFVIIFVLSVITAVRRAARFRRSRFR